MTGLKINLFGQFRVLRDGQPIEAKEWDRQKTRSLLKLLLTRPGQVFSRDEIRAILWPPVARCLSNIRGASGLPSACYVGRSKTSVNPTIPPPEMRTFIYDLLSERIDSVSYVIRA